MKAEPTTQDLIAAMPMTFPGRVIADRQRIPALQSVQAQVSVNITGESNTADTANRNALLSVLRTAHVLDDAILESNPPYFWPGLISNTMLDSYDTRMDPQTTLKNFVEDAIAGVSFCDTHNHNELAFGRSFAAVLEAGEPPSAEEAILLNDAEPQLGVIAGFYTLPGMKTNRVATDDLILSMRGGITKDLSVGFKPGPGFMYRCSICGRDLWDWDCEHIPGMIYEVTENDTADAPTVKRYAFAWIINARLSEVSGAYDGATPKCMILKATREAEGGRIPARIAALVEQRCRIHLPGKRVSAPGLNPEQERSTMTEEEKLREAARKAIEDLLGVGRSSLVRLGLVKSGEENVVNTPQDVITRLHDEVLRLQPLAAEGVLLRKELVDSAIVEGSRALAKNFNEELQRKTLMSLDIENVKTMRSNWEEVGDAKLGKGKGRQTEDEIDGDTANKDQRNAGGTRKPGGDEEEDIDDDSVFGI